MTIYNLILKFINKPDSINFQEYKKWMRKVTVNLNSTIVNHSYHGFPQIGLSIGLVSDIQVVPLLSNIR